MAGSGNDFFVRVTSLPNGQELWKCAGTMLHILEAFKHWVANQSAACKAWLLWYMELWK